MASGRDGDVLQPENSGVFTPQGSDSPLNAPATRRLTAGVRLTAGTSEELIDLALLDLTMETEDAEPLLPPAPWPPKPPGPGIRLSREAASAVTTDLVADWRDVRGEIIAVLIGL